MRVNNYSGNRLFKCVLSAILLLLVAACGKGDAYILLPQLWNETEFLVEIRPGAPQQGMNEFVVVATETKGPPGYNYIVSIKMDNSERWAQMIQDGHSGVYRRAIGVADPANGVLIVQIKHKSDEKLQTELKFPLAKHI
jgi:hypothetical protein